jgi:uncharacterized Zn finger protein
MLIIGTHFFSWGSQPSGETWQCGKCSTVGEFVRRKGMRFLTIFFIIPVCPLSGVKQLLRCPTCGAQYEEKHLNADGHA